MMTLRSKAAVVAVVVLVSTFALATSEAGKKRKYRQVSVDRERQASMDAWRQTPEYAAIVAEATRYGAPMQGEPADPSDPAVQRHIARVRASLARYPAIDWTKSFGEVKAWQTKTFPDGGLRVIPYIDEWRTDAATVAARAEIERIVAEHEKKFPYPEDWKRKP